MIKSITLKFTDGERHIELPAQGITVFVGPNNSGKSLVLREIEMTFSSSINPTDMKIVDDFDIIWPDQDQIGKDLQFFDGMRPRTLPEDHIYIGRFAQHGEFESHTVQKERLISEIMGRANKRWVAYNFLRFFLVRLDGRTRFNLTNDCETGDLLEQPRNILSHLFVNDPLRKEVRSLVFEAFNLHFVIDPTRGGSLRIRLAQREPPIDEQSLNHEARRFHSEAIYVKDASDGVQAYVGIVSAVLSGYYRALLIDEPEAFLHPPLARKLGKQLASIASERAGSMFASTHSADFLIGCIQATKDVRVVRLEYANGRSKAKVVDPNLLEAIFKSPLMRSANVISSLFHDGVVVTESDNDRAFYSEVYYRLSEHEEGMPSLLFVNAQNKQTAKDIIGPLRQFGIPAAAIVDVDVLKDGGKVWSGWLDAANVPGPLHNGYAAQRDSLKKCFDQLGKDMKRDGGVAALDAEGENAARELLQTLSAYGVFVVPGGELESWLPTLGAVGKKTDWVISALDKMGSDPNSENYLKPSAGDVWDFIRGIVAWMRDPARKGTA